MNDTAKRARASAPEYPMRAPLLQWRGGVAQLRIDAYADQLAEAAHREHARLAQQARHAVEVVVLDWLNDLIARRMLDSVCRAARSVA